MARRGGSRFLVPTYMEFTRSLFYTYIEEGPVLVLYRYRRRTMEFKLPTEHVEKVKTWTDDRKIKFQNYGARRHDIKLVSCFILRRQAISFLHF